MKKCFVILISLLIIATAWLPGCNDTAPIYKNLNLINDIVDISAEGYYHVPFSIDINTMKDVKVEGNIEVTPGTGVELDRVGNTRIDFLILDYAMFATWANTNLYYLKDGQLHLSQYGLSPQWYLDAVYEDNYSSAHSWTIVPSVEITSSGDYHLVFSNRASPFISKFVTADIDLIWSE